MNSKPSNDSRHPLCDQFRALCLANIPRPDVFVFLSQHPQAPPRDIADVVLWDLQESWNLGQPRPVRQYLDHLPVLVTHLDLMTELIAEDYRLQRQHQRDVDLDSYVMQFPGLQHQLLALLCQPLSPVRSPEQTIVDPQLPPIVIPAQPSPRQPRTMTAAVPKQIGRYQVRRILGSGSFGTVFEANDETLRRAVAIKIPNQVQAPQSRELFLNEARHLAALNHPGIVPIYDFGVLDDGRCYVVARLIAGDSLSTVLKRRKLTPEESVRIVAEIAEALHHAHLQQLVHRDVKPGNILLESEGRAYLADFGLALNEDQQRSQPDTIAGTIAYMSPEQTRGESRFLDGRSDIWSLGVVLYEMLAGRRPFQGSTRLELLREIQQREPKPLRVLEASVPEVLEQICQKCLAKNLTVRFQTAADLAQKLREFLSGRVAPTVPSPGPAATLRVISARKSERDGFPILSCTLMNRMGVSQAVLCVRSDVTAFEGLRGSVATRELIALTELDVDLPLAVASLVTDLRHPVLIGDGDGATIDVRLVCHRDEGQLESPASVGGFVCRLVFITDSGLEASTNEFTLGRFSTTGSAISGSHIRKL